MLKFLLGKGQQHAAERQRLQKELFAYRKTAQHGFPHKPSALAYDAVLKLMAIGTQTGAIKIFGQPGVEFYGQHILMNNCAAELNVRLIEWITGTGRLLSLTAANQLILWEPVGFTLMAIKSMSFDNELKKISSVCCSLNTDIIWIGTEAGHVYQFDLNTFDVTGIVIYNDAVMSQVPPTYKLNPGAIEAVRQIPNDQYKLLIAYNRGLCVLWDTQNELVTRAYIAPGHGQSVGLYINAAGTQFTWYHADGSFATWNLTNGEPPKNVNYVPYGPDPCKSIDRLYTAKRGDIELSIFSGGMPRSAYGDHNCVSIHSSDGHKICLDFTSKVIDFFVTYQRTTYCEEAEALIILLEEELCAYDLTRPDVPPLKAPYLHSIHASAVTCNYLASQVSQDVYNRICKSGLQQDRHYSSGSLEWPINGGNISKTCKTNENDSFSTDGNDDDGDHLTNAEYDILLTGHEDGSVKFWNCTGVALQPIYHFKTALLYGSENDENDGIGENIENLDPSEPPFRRAGLFDPYSDDPRLAVKKIAFCSKTGRLIVGGTAGQIVVACFLTDNNSNNAHVIPTTFKYCSMNLVSDRDGFVWKGHDQLNVRSNLLSSITAEVIGDKGVCITGVVQVLPPASITCLALESNWGLLAGGTAHGLVLFDFQHFLPIYHRCTLNPNDLTGAGELLSRRKSFKKSLRESFRKLRKGRSTRSTHAKNQVSTTLESRPIERQVEARSADDAMGSMVRCLLFAKTYITNFHTTSPTLWSATNASTVSVFLLHLPLNSNSNTGVGDATPITTTRCTAQFVKQLRLKHGAPVVGIAIFDSTGNPVDQVSGSSTGSGAPPHHVLIASEEQFKIFSLPQLKPLNKYKLTANEGARVRRIHFATFKCRIPPEIVQGLTSSAGSSPTKSLRSQDQQQQQNVIAKNGDLYQETALLCLTNLGDIMVLSVPELRRQLNAAAVRREDISGICSLCFTNSAEGIYMMSSSELQRISLANSKITIPMGQVNVTPLKGGRPIDDNTEEQEQEENEMEKETAAVHHHLNSQRQSQGPIKTTATPSTIITVTHKSPIYKKPTFGVTKTLEVNDDAATITNGIGGTSSDGNSYDNSPNRNANETITSSVGDITVDSVRDYLNATTSTLCSTTTEETVGRLSVLSTQTNQTLNTIKMKENINENVPSIIELMPPSSTTETSTSSVVIKSIITSISHEKTNGETEIITTKTSTHEESQF